MSQLPLALPLEPNARFDTFVAGPDDGVVRHLQELARGERNETVWLAGEPDSGKTHLLQAACRAASDHGLRAIYLDPGEGLPPGALDSLGALDFVAIDDVTRLAGDAASERALFAVLNDFYKGEGALVLAADVAPKASGFRLPDLQSRAAGATVYRLTPLSDEARQQALDQLARIRGIELDDAACAYLLRRVRRDMRAVAQWLDVIDRESLAASRSRVTVPFVRALLSRFGADAAAEPDRDLG